MSRTGAVRRALHAHTEPNVSWIMACNWATMLLMAATVHWLQPLQPLQQQAALRWLAVGSAYSLAFVLWRRLNPGASMRAKEVFYAISVGVFSALWVAVPLLFFDPGNFAFSMFMLTIQGGLGAASVSIFAAWLPLYWLWVVPPFLAQMAVYFWVGGAGIYWSVSLGMLILLASQLVFARNHQRTIIGSIRLGMQNAQLVEQLQEKTHLAESANRAKTMFLAAASHDLRQPVYALTLFLDALGNSKLDERQRGMVQHARAANHASNEMLRTLLDFSRVEAGVLNPVVRPMPLAPLLTQLEEEFGPQAFRKDLLYRARATPLWAHSDPQLVALVLRNLISNALRYTATGGVLVGARRCPGQDAVKVQVWDTGIGIPAEKHEEIFLEFHQLGNAERDHRKGLGMGLAIARGLARSLDARIQLSSRPGRGSVFSLVLPAAPSPERSPPLSPVPLSLFAPGEDAAASHAAAALAAPGKLHGLRILVVDDDDTVRRGLQAVLQDWGCNVALAEGLQDALVLARHTRPDLVLTDYRLRAGVNGGQVLHALRQALPAPASATGPGGELHAIIVTGDTHPDRLKEAASHGALLLHKPLDAQALKAAMLAVLRGSAETQAL